MINIIKASGLKVPFDAMKIRLSLHRVGADEPLIEEIIKEVEQSLSEGMTTHQVYRIAFRLLHRKSHLLAAKYHLKRAIMQLGVSGYPFEKYIAALLQQQGYHVANNLIVQGYCVSHEVDVVASQEKKTIFVECKYHNRLGITCDVKVSLYFKARFMDIEQEYARDGRHGEKIEGWLVTNTRFSNDALKYGRCAGLHLISWDFPHRDGLREQIEVSRLYPITCITNFTRAEISQLLSQDIILCKSIRDAPKLLDSLHIPSPRRNEIIQKCHDLMNVVI